VSGSGQRPRLVLATRNAGKLRELAALCGPGLEVISAEELPGAPEVIEDGETFGDNARKKAVALARFSGLPALADDSGLCVDALHGVPGVLSARYAQGSDDDRVAKLLQELEGIPTGARGAHFTCALCLALSPGTTVEVEGRLAGRIGVERRGHGGFGYDPVFLMPDGRSLAEMPAPEKNQISHRARALALIRPHLLELPVRSNLPRSSGVG